MAVVEDFVTLYAERDWDRLASCFSKGGFERIGPYGDVIASIPCANVVSAVE